MRLAVAGATFVAAFLFVFLRNDYYPPATLSIEGTTDGPLTLNVRWDSGEGFNPFERVEYRIRDPAAFAATVDHFAVRRLADRNPEAKGGEVWLLEVATDEQPPVDLKTLQVPGETRLTDDGRLVLSADGQTVHLDGHFETVRVRLFMHPWSGKAELWVNGQSRVVDLYSATPRTMEVELLVPKQLREHSAPYHFVRTLQLPQHRTKRLQLTAVPPFHLERLTIHGPRTLELPVGDGQRFRWHVWRVRNADRTQLHYILLTVHFGMAALAAAAAYGLLGLRRRLGRPSWTSTVRWVFVEDRRPLLWTMFLVSSAWMSLWLLGQWPGMLSPDCVTTWTEIHNLHLVNWSPFLHTLYAMALVQLYRSPASIAVFQILTIAAIGAFLFYRLVRLGVTLAIVMPFFALFVLSIPNGVFAIVPWRDIPFSYLMLVTAFVVFELRLRRSRDGSAPHISRGALFWLALLLAVVSVMRHNGAVNLVILPALLLVTQALARRQLLRLVVLASVLYVGVQFGLGYWVRAHQNFDYNKMRISIVLNPIAGVMTARGGYYTRDPAEDAAIVGRFMSVDELKHFYNPYSVVSALYRPDNRWDLTPEEMQRLQRLYLRLVRDNIPLFLANQVITFGSTVGYRNYKYEHLVRTPDNWIWKRQGADLAGNNTLKSLRFEPWSTTLQGWEDRVLAATYEYAGFFSPSHLVWNAWLPLVMVVVFTYLYAFFPASAAAAGFLLVHLLLLFLVVLSADFRYVYWLYLYGFFAVPMLVAEYRVARHARA